MDSSNPSQHLFRRGMFAAFIFLAGSMLVSSQPLLAQSGSEKGDKGKSAKQDTKSAAKENESKGDEAKDEDSGPVPRVSLSEITGGPGASLMVPFYYTPDPKDPLRSIAVDIDYVGTHLKFQKASRGVIPDDIGLNIDAKVDDSAPDSKGIVRSKLHINVAMTDKNSQKGLPDGMLAFLMFTVSLDAKPFTIKLTPTVVNSEDVHNKKIAKVSTVPGTVTVEIPDLLPEATCFFFNH
jgi:hypothetical protein